MDRLISLNAVLSAIGEWIAHREYDYTNATEYLRNRIKAIPSAEPKTDNDLDMKLKLMEANINGYTQGLKDASNTEQESKYCDRNICIKNEYNGIGCEECEVTKSQEPKTGHWIFDYTAADGHRVYHCSKCGCYLKPKHSEPLCSFKWCSLCGAKMIEPQKISDHNLKMWHDIYAEEKRRKGSDKK